MATLQVPVRIKRTEVAGRIPQAADLAVGELGVNLVDKKLYSKTTAGDVVAVGDGNTRSFASDGAPVNPGEVAGQIYVQLPAQASGALQSWIWDESTSNWNQFPVVSKLREATDVEDVDPADGDLLAYDVALGQWAPVSGFVVSQSRSFVNVSGTVVIDDTRHYKSLVYSGVSPVAEFAAGAEGVLVEIYNRTTNALTLQAAAGVTLTVPSGFNFLRPGGTAEAVFANGVWSVSGDLFLPGSTQAFDLEDAQDYAAAGTKADGDLLTWDATAQKFTTAPIDTSAIETYLQGNLQLGELANVNIAAQVDQTYLFYNAAAGEWQAQELPLDSIAEDVQLRTDLGELSDVVITNPADLDQIAYDLSSGTWVNVPGGDITLKANKLAEIKSIPANYTVLADDSTKVLQVLGLATITLPNDLDPGFQVVVIQTGTEDVNFTASTLLSSGNRTYLRTQYSVATAVHLGSGTWYIFGDLRLEGALEVPDLLGDLVDVSATPPTTNQVLSWTGSIWAPTTINTGADLASSSINELADVDTTTAAPTTGQVLAWNGSTWAPGTAGGDVSSASIGELADVDTTTAAPTTGQGLIWNGTAWAPGAAGGADLSTASIGDLGDVETTQFPPQQDQALIYNGQEWAPGDVVQYMDSHSIQELFDVNAPNAYGQTSDAYGRRALLYNVNTDEWGTNGNICRIQAQTSFDFYSGDPNNRRSTSNIRNSVYTNNGLKYVELITDGDAMSASNFNYVRMAWPVTQPEYSGIMFADWDQTNYLHRLDMRPIYLADVAELNAGPYTTGDSIFWDGVKWSVGDVFTPGTAVPSTDLGASSAYMLGAAGLYTDQAAMEADGWTYIAGAEYADDYSTGFDPGPAWTGLDFLGLGVSSQNWKVADVGVFFDADPAADLDNFDQPMTVWGFDLLVQAFTSDSTSYQAGWQVYNDGSQDWLVVRIDHQIPYGDDPDGIPVEYWFSQDGRVRLVYGTPSDSGGEAHTFIVGPTSNGVASNGLVVVNPSGLTVSGNRAFEFASLSTPGVVINRLADVDTTGATAGDTLVYNGETWVPEAVYAATLQKIHLAHFDTVGAVPTVDDGADSLPLLWNTDPSVSTVSSAQSKFGGASLQTNGNGGGYQVNVGPTGSTWTFDFWVWVSSSQSFNSPYIFRSPSYVLGFNTSSVGVYFDTFAGGGFSDEIWTGGNGYTPQTWQHIAVQRVGFRYRMWVDGVHVGTITDSNVNDGDSTFFIGSGARNYYFNGYMDEVRFTHAQQYPDDGTNFTPPVAPYS